MSGTLAARPELDSKYSEEALEKASSSENVEPKHPVEFTEEEEKKVVRRIDWTILPLMVTTWGLAYYDKTMMGQAVLFGFRKDLDLINPGSRYSNVSMIFFMGYILGLAPLGYVTQRTSTRKSCFVIVFIWGILSLCTVACKSYAGILIQRFLLGFFEAGIGPSFITMTGIWYTQQEQALRAPIWVASAPLTNIFTPMLNYGLGSVKGSLAGWQHMYLFAGTFTIFWSFIVLWRMPDGITQCKFLDDRQKEIALERIRRSNGGAQSKVIKKEQVWEAVCDYNIWGLLILAFTSYAPNAVLTTFSSLLIKDLGYTTLENLAVQIPKGVVGVAAGLACGWFNRKYAGWRFYSYSICIGVALCGSIALLLAPKVPGLLGALYALHLFGAAAGQVYAMASSNVSGQTKRTAAAVSLSVGTAAAQAAVPLLFDTDQAPKYTRGFIATIIITASGCIIAQVLRFGLMMRNRTRDKAGHVGTEHGLEDITDKVNKDFRYAL